MPALHWHRCRMHVNAHSAMHWAQQCTPCPRRKLYMEHFRMSYSVHTHSGVCLQPPTSTAHTRHGGTHNMCVHTGGTLPACHTHTTLYVCTYTHTRAVAPRACRVHGTCTASAHVSDACVYTCMCDTLCVCVCVQLYRTSGCDTHTHTHTFTPTPHVPGSPRRCA